jgi:hypothetical protein
MCVSALGLTLLLLVTPAFAFEPMPPIMQKLLEVFPEENGRFVDEPFGSIESTPKEARPLFETFRVVVPTPDDIDKSLARLFSASSHFPIKKITRYDKDPGAPGLAGFRGAWCQTEDESQVGFSIVTINQNRFLIWAKMGYYPSFTNDSINPKVRDQYARDVSQYLAGIDMKVPDNEAPPASGRGLPVVMDLYPPESKSHHTMEERLLAGSEIKAWGLHDVDAFTPTGHALARMIENAIDTLWPNLALHMIQYVFHEFVSGGGTLNLVNNYSRPLSDSLLGVKRQRLNFAIDRYGRLRYSDWKIPGWQCHVAGSSAHALLFPCAQVRTAGYLEIEPFVVDSGGIRVVSIGPLDNCFLSDVEISLDFTVTRISDRFMECLPQVLSYFRRTIPIPTRGGGLDSTEYMPLSQDFVFRKY